ncbi:MAG: hypothetical protein JRJ26_09740 [Deltaproteobacteria bacterium]|nr:hypothetical protein [Deltaproteobacteria bacterium]
MDLLEGLNDIEKFEVCTRALTEASRVLVTAIRQLSETADRLEILCRVQAKLISENDRTLWERALHEALDRKPGRAGQRRRAA